MWISVEIKKPSGFLVFRTCLKCVRFLRTVLLINVNNYFSCLEFRFECAPQDF